MYMIAKPRFLKRKVSESNSLNMAIPRLIARNAQIILPIICQLIWEQKG